MIYNNKYFSISVTLLLALTLSSSLFSDWKSKSFKTMKFAMPIASATLIGMTVLGMIVTSKIQSNKGKVPEDYKALASWVYSKTTIAVTSISALVTIIFFIMYFIGFGQTEAAAESVPDLKVGDKKGPITDFLGASVEYTPLTKVNSAISIKDTNAELKVTADEIKDTIKRNPVLAALSKVSSEAVGSTTDATAKAQYMKSVIAAGFNLSQEEFDSFATKQEEITSLGSLYDELAKVGRASSRTVKSQLGKLASEVEAPISKLMHLDSLSKLGKYLNELEQSSEGIYITDARVELKLPETREDAMKATNLFVTKAVPGDLISLKSKAKK